jgi:lipid-binding SYLF domain-containing protein
MWSNTKGAYVGATVSVSDVNWDDDNNAGFYGRKVTPSQILEGKITANKAGKLKSALPS